MKNNYNKKHDVWRKNILGPKQQYIYHSATHRALSIFGIYLHAVKNNYSNSLDKQKRNVQCESVLENYNFVF